MNKMNMIKNTTLAFLLSLFCVAPIAAQCPAGEIEVIFELDTDQYWYESNWLIKDAITGQVLVADVAVDSTYHSYTYCLPDNGCKQFEMRDDYGDGMTPDGWFRVTVNGTVVRTMNNPNYIFKKDSFEFGCAPGSKCADAIPIDTGSWVTPDFSRTWYSFIPADTGVYTINACDTLNTCKTRLWVYSTCANIFISNDLTGALFYAADSCNGGVNTSLYLAGGREYIFRIEPDLNSCPEPEPIHFELSFNGPIIGCTDPAACNYNPLATIPSTCLPQGDPDCPSAPDLVTDENLFRNSLILNVTDNTQPCDVKERCLRGLGNRFVLEFNTKIKNIGDADYYIGRKPADSTVTTSTQFVYDVCHKHWHYIGYAEYILFNSAGYRLPIGTKAGFCVFDLECPTWQPRKFNCEVMGLTAGCADVYQIGLPCQSVDITDIPPDDYTLVIWVDWD
jgi:hypothetical protein